LLRYHGSLKERLLRYYESLMVDRRWRTIGSHIPGHRLRVPQRPLWGAK
jgi:hypothetical protein